MKNEAKLKQMGLQPRYYYERYGEYINGKAIGGVTTVCVIRIPSDDGKQEIVIRGLSFCNPIDQFSRKEGRARALGRAAKAIKNQASTEPVPMKTPAWIITQYHDWEFLSMFDVEPTKFEKEILGIDTKTVETPEIKLVDKEEGEGEDKSP